MVVRIRIQPLALGRCGTPAEEASRVESGRAAGFSRPAFAGGRPVYPHRSVRSLHVAPGRISISLGAAFILSCAVAVLATTLLSLHGKITAFLLALSGIPVTAWERIEVFAAIGSTAVPVTPVLAYDEHWTRAVLLFAAAVIALIVVYQRVALARNFILFLLTLFVVTGIIVVLEYPSGFDSLVFTRIWLRLEILVWLILPWLAVFLFGPIHRSVFQGIGWAVLVEAYGFLWSAVRLAFCLGVLHQGGTLFLPVMWFCIGLLADVLYVLVFYSIGVHRASRQICGMRAAWKY